MVFLFVCFTRRKVTQCLCNVFFIYFWLIFQFKTISLMTIIKWACNLQVINGKPLNVELILVKPLNRTVLCDEVLILASPLAVAAGRLREITLSAFLLSPVTSHSILEAEGHFSSACPTSHSRLYYFITIDKSICNRTVLVVLDNILIGNVFIYSL